MATQAANQTWPGGKARGSKRLAVKAATLLALGIIFGWGYAWAAPRLYGPDHVGGFRLGVLHGALMPTALPTLLMGKDVPIYATANTGRIYKIGYIAGINLCGLLFFGVAFQGKQNPRNAA